MICLKFISSKRNLGAMMGSWKPPECQHSPTSGRGRGMGSNGCLVILLKEEIRYYRIAGSRKEWGRGEERR